MRHRLFVAIPLPDEGIESLTSIFHGIPNAKWKNEDQLHLTLQFIGEVDQRSYDHIRGALANIHFPSFPLEIHGIGHFASKKVPKILWAGVKSNDSLLDLQKEISKSLKHFPSPDKKKFIPHITLAKLRNVNELSLAQYFQSNSLFNFGPFPITEFNLYSSILTSEKAIYHVEESYELAGC
jgi:2'-5' RNA ligase